MVFQFMSLLLNKHSNKEKNPKTDWLKMAAGGSWVEGDKLNYRYISVYLSHQIILFGRLCIIEKRFLLPFLEDCWGACVFTGNAAGLVCLVMGTNFLLICIDCGRVEPVF